MSAALTASSPPHVVVFNPLLALTRASPASFSTQQHSCLSAILALQSSALNVSCAGTPAAAAAVAAVDDALFADDPEAARRMASSRIESAACDAKMTALKIHTLLLARRLLQSRCESATSVSSSSSSSSSSLPSPSSSSSTSTSSSSSTFAPPPADADAESLRQFLAEHAHVLQSATPSERDECEFQARLSLGLPIPPFLQQRPIVSLLPSVVASPPAVHTGPPASAHLPPSRLTVLPSVDTAFSALMALGIHTVQAMTHASLPPHAPPPAAGVAVGDGISTSVETAMDPWTAPTAQITVGFPVLAVTSGQYYFEALVPLHTWVTVGVAATNHTPFSESRGVGQVCGSWGFNVMDKSSLDDDGERMEWPLTIDSDTQTHVVVGVMLHTSPAIPYGRQVWFFVSGRRICRSFPQPSVVNTMSSNVLCDADAGGSAFPLAHPVFPVVSTVRACSYREMRSRMAIDLSQPSL
jgi:hypothetical protein